jgi:predicted Abi (CAAX) family protease
MKVIRGFITLFLLTAITLPLGLISGFLRLDFSLQLTLHSHQILLFIIHLMPLLSIEMVIPHF